MPRLRASIAQETTKEGPVTETLPSTVASSSTKSRPPTTAFPDAIKKFFQQWVETRNNKALFDSAKRIRYRWILTTPEAPIQGTKEEKRVKFNERNDALKHFLLKDNQLYRKSLKAGQRERQVVCDYDAADVIERIHCELEHAGNNKTFQKVNELYYGVNKVMVEWFLKRCAVCLNHRKSNTRAPLEPIIASQVLERVQVDLVDMRSQRDGDMLWICHLKCHFSKFSVLYPMPNKKASTVAGCLETYITHVGIPDIVQCDNGTEFKGAALILLKNYGVKVINGRPRTPRTQGLVEQANGVMKDKLKKRIKATGNHRWSQHLLRVALAMNVQGHDSLPYNMTPYEVFFGRKYRQRPNSLVTVHEQQEINTHLFSDETIDTSCERNAFDLTLADVLRIHLEYEVDDETHETDSEREGEIDIAGQYISFSS